MITDLIKLSLKRTKNRMLESVTVILSLGFGLAIISAIVSLIIGFNNEKKELDNEEWNRRIVVQPKEYNYNYSDQNVFKLGDKSITDSVLFSLEDIENFKNNCPEIQYAFIENWPGIGMDEEYEGNDWWNHNPVIFGVNNDYFLFNEMKIESGSFFANEDYISQNNVAIIGANIAELLFGAETPIGKEISYGEKSFIVTGVLEENYSKSREIEKEEIKEDKWNKNNYILIPYTVENWNRDFNKVEYFELGIEDSSRLEIAVSEVEYYIESEYPSGGIGVLSALDWGGDFVESASHILKIIAFIAAVALIISTLTNLNLMLARVNRDRKGFGISAALGASKNTIFLNTLLDAAVIGVIGTILGIFLMIIFVIACDRILGSNNSIVNATLTPVNFIVNLIIAMVITSLFSLFPAIEAVKISPTQVLKED